MKNSPMKLNTLFIAIIMLWLLQGCAGLVIGGATSAINAAKDRRTLGMQIDDNTIEVKAALLLREVEALQEHTHIVVKSVNGHLLVVGQAPTQHLKDLAIKTLQALTDIKRIHNQIKLSEPTSIKVRTLDVWLTTRIKVKLFASEHIDANNIAILTENSEVFLMGIVSAAEAKQAAEIASSISGVTKVIKVFELI